MGYRKSIALNFCFFALGCAGLVDAQVPVREEPHHKVVLENDYIRLIDVHIPAGDTTLYHLHAAPSVIVHLSQAVIGSQVMGEKPSVPGEVLPGQTSYAAYDLKPIKHRVWNQSKSVFHVMDIELAKKAPSGNSCPTSTQKNLKLQWQQQLVRTYTMDISPGKQLHIHPSGCAHLLIAISGILTSASSGMIHMVQSGGYVFFPPQSDIAVTGGKENAHVVLLELN